MYDFHGKGAFAHSHPFARRRPRRKGGALGAGAVVRLLASLHAGVGLLVLLATLPTPGLNL